MDWELFNIFLAFIIGVLIHSVIIEFSHKKNMFMDAQLKVQKVHKTPVPRIGGLGVFLASLFMVFDQDIGQLLVISTIPVFLAGFIEDFTENASPLHRLLIMSLGPILLYAFLHYQGFTHTFAQGYWAALLFISLFLFINGIINGVNFIDGSNGLAGGSAFITSLAITILASIVGDQSLFYLAAILSASILAFLIFNFPNAKIFLGDSGSYTLGFYISSLTILLVFRNHDYIDWMFIPVLLMYPIVEVGFSIFRKVFIDKLSPVVSDRNHLHQLIFRNVKYPKPYIPVMTILPFQVLFLLLAIIFRGYTVILFAIFVLFVVLYVTMYTRERKIMYRRYKEMRSKLKS